MSGLCKYQNIFPDSASHGRKFRKDGEGIRLARLELAGFQGSIVLKVDSNTAYAIIVGHGLPLQMRGKRENCLFRSDMQY